MKLTAQQNAAVKADENVLLTACPGSGKTRVIVSKLMRAIDSVRGTPRSIACITYTNAAVQEIELRLRRHIQIGDDAHYDVCTIHSFCLNFIFRPFSHRIRGFEEGFKVLTPDSDAFVEFVTQTCNEFRRFNLRSADIEEFAQLQTTVDGEPTGLPLVSGGVKVDEAKLFWRTIRSAGYVDFCSILFFSLDLVRTYPDVVDYLASRFAWILVDEFQDTTDIQVEILGRIADRARTKFFLVGDPLQSIYGFAGARPELADAFAKRINARTDLVLSGNFRCGPKIVEDAEKIFKRYPAMKSVGEAANYTESPEYQHGATAFAIVTDHFLPTIEALNIPVGDAAILAPTWFTLFPLGRKLREYGVNVVGPGARPYRRSRLFAQLAENVCGYLSELSGEFIPNVERALFNTILEATGRPQFSIFSYEGRTRVMELLAVASQLAQRHESGIEWLDAAATEFSDILTRAEYLPTESSRLLPESVGEMKRDMLNNRIDLNNLTIADLGVYASPNAALKLSTLHNAKGREFSAVAMIDMHEGKIPFYMAKTEEEFTAARRLFYVGLTRARRVLLYATDTSDRRNVPTRFLRDGGVGRVLSR